MKCDCRETLSDLIVEDVFPLWTQWCRARGIATRNEAHGSPANWLDFYALADIPETEMFGKDRDVLVSKFASSAAHVKHFGSTRAPLVSAESCTWIDEHFCETPGEVKKFLDMLFLSGVNHVFYHGMCYSPDGANRIKWLDAAKPYQWKICTDINMVDRDYRKFDASGWKQREYGLYGPVRVMAYPAKVR